MSGPAKSERHAGSYEIGSARPAHTDQYLSSEQHGHNYAPGSAAPAYTDPTSRPVYNDPISPAAHSQHLSREQHGHNYAPGSAVPVYTDPSSCSDYKDPISPTASQIRIPRRPVASVQSNSPLSTLSTIPPAPQFPGHYAVNSSQRYDSYPRSAGYGTPNPNPATDYPAFLVESQGQYNDQIYVGSQPTPYAPYSAAEPVFAGSGPQTYGHAALSRNRNNARANGESKSVAIVDLEAATEEESVPAQNPGLIPHVPLKGYRNLVGHATAVRLFKYPHFYKPADCVYHSAEKFKNKDSMLRFHEGVKDDRYISPYNGRTEELVVQAVDEIYNRSDSEDTWHRTFIRDISPWHLRLANWPENHIPYEDRILGRVTYSQKAVRGLKYAASAIALLTVIAFPGNVEGEIRNGGRYDAFPYKFHGYSKVARNLLEEKIVRQHVDLGHKTQAVMTSRILKPRKLCRLDAVPKTESNPFGLDVVDVGENEVLPYLFAAYTTEQFPIDSPPHNEQLVRMAAEATREHALSAFWISCCCVDMSSDRRLADGRTLQEDVYRISDVIRGAEAVVILVGPSAPSHNEDADRASSVGSRIRQWGARMWTFPEVLLSRGSVIKVYDATQHQTFNFTKLDFANMAWPDKDVSRQLIDHYEGTLQLSRLELVIIALECLLSRQRGDFLPGDHSYALMGLLRVRPQIDESDTSFQAFARLSLANDSDLLLERLACVLPRDPNQPWYAMDDAYGASLWDIYPSCQIAGIGDDNTIIVDGARGANVRWKSFASVHVLRRWSWTRLLFRILLHTSSIALIVGAILLWIAHWIRKKERAAAAALMSPFAVVKDFKEYYDEHGSFLTDLSDTLKNLSTTAGDMYDNLNNDALVIVHAIARIVVDEKVIEGFGVLFMIWAMSMMVVAPKAIRTLYGGKLWNTQPWLFGFEGYLPIEQIEYLIFGDTKNRLRWHPFGSPLSKHKVDESWEGGHCEPVDPTTDADVKAMVENAKISQLGDQKIFTLVDTNTMTVTIFQAARPPVCFLLLGSEGGMQRAVGCSFDWTTSTLYRETVLRMETSCRDKMDLVSRAKISLERREKPKTRPAPQRSKFDFTGSSDKFSKKNEPKSG